MALVKCSECQTEVSDRAANCPKCACPLVAVAVAPPTPSQAAEKTGKKYKVQIILSTALICSGVFLIALGAASGDANGSGIPIGLILAPIGLLWLGIVKFVVWWRHG